jgi:23S rRNA pseudouridine2605 synthase
VSGPDLERDADGLVRLHKLLARSGIASRRRCEELMLAGEVTVDGEVVTRLGTKIDPATAVVRVSGRRMPPISPHVYLACNKPVGVTSTMSDPHASRTLADLVEDRPERLFHVGRLDTDTSGLLLMTNDNRFAEHVTNPTSHVPKTYLVKASQLLTDAQLQQLRDGIELSDGPTRPAVVTRVRDSEKYTHLEITLTEGRNRQVRRMVEAVGARVLKLVRVKVGPIAIGRLSIGKWRLLKRAEVAALAAGIRNRESGIRAGHGARNPDP